MGKMKPNYHTRTLSIFLQWDGMKKMQFLSHSKRWYKEYLDPLTMKRHECPYHQNSPKWCKWKQTLKFLQVQKVPYTMMERPSWKDPHKGISQCKPFIATKQQNNRNLFLKKISEKVTWAWRDISRTYF